MKQAQKAESQELWAPFLPRGQIIPRPLTNYVVWLIGQEEWISRVTAGRGILRMLTFGKESTLTGNLVRENNQGHKVWGVRSAKGSKECPRSNAEQGPRTAVLRTCHPVSPVLEGVPFIGQKLDIVKKRKPQASYPRGETEPWVMYSSSKRKDAASGGWYMKTSEWRRMPVRGAG